MLVYCLSFFCYLFYVLIQLVAIEQHEQLWFSLSLLSIFCSIYMYF